MTLHLGKVPAGSTLYIPFATYGGTNGESITLTGLAVTDIEIYKNGSTTQRASDAGYALLDTDGIDFDGITGIHGFSIDLSDNTDSGFYAVGSTYWVVVSAVTVDAQTVNFIAATFRIGPAESITGHDKVDLGGIGGDAQSMTDLKDFADAGYDPSTNKVQGVVLVDTLTTYTGNTPQTGDTYALANGASGFVATKADTAAILLDTGTDGVVVAAGSKSGYALSSSGMDAVTLPANLITASSIAADAITSAKVDASVHQELIELAFTYDATATYAGADAGSLVKQIADNAGGSSLTAADIADAVWEEAVADHSGTSGSTAEALAAAGGAGDPWITTLPGIYTGSQAGKILADILVDTGTTLQGELDGIQADTEDIQSRLPAALVSGRIDASVGAMAANTLTASALATDAVTEIQSGLATSASIAALNDLSSAEAQAAAEAAIAASDVATNTDLDALIATVGVAGAGLTEAGGTGDHLTALATAAALATVDTEVGVIDGIVDSILVDTTQMKADLPSRPTKAAQFDNLMFLMVDETDLATPETGVTVTATISKDGGSFAACTNAVSEVSGGWYKITLTSTEMNADSIAVKFTGTGCAQRNLAIRTQP